MELQTNTAAYAPAIYNSPTASAGNRKQTVYSINPRLTRYIFIPLAPLNEQPVSAFYVPEIPPNEFFPLRVFDFPVMNANGNQTALEKLPGEQVLDLQTVVGSRIPYNQFLDFAEIAKLDNEDAASQIFTVLTNPHICTKYGTRLKNKCLSCWSDYLSSEAIERIQTLDSALQPLAFSALEQLQTLFEDARQTADREVAMALQLVDDKTAGKSKFYDIDYLNIMHTHKDMPKFRTTADNERGMSDALNALTKVLEHNQAPGHNGLSREEIADIIVQATAPQISKINELESRLAKYEPLAEDTPKVCKGIKTRTGEPCKVLVTDSDYCSFHKE